MCSLNKIDKYVDTVCQQIRWKKARIRVSEEIANHIIDGRDLYMAQGLDEKAATEKAIAETGDATDIGTQLDRVHRPKPQWGMFAVTALLMLFGLIIRLFIFNNGDREEIFTGVLCIGIGITGMIAAYFADFTIIGKYPKTIYFCIIAISVAMILFLPTTYGSSSYAQYIVLLFPLAFSAIIYKTRNKGYLGILLCGLAFVLPGFISLYISSISGFIHFTIVGAALLAIAVYKKWFNKKRTYSFLLMLIPAALLIFVFLASISSHGWERLATAFNPSIDPNGAGYTGVMIRKLLSGAIFLGQGNIPNEYIAGLTEPYQIFSTDFLLTILISLLGWISFTVIISAFLLFMVKGFILCLKQKSSLGLFVSMSILLTFCVQVLSYVAYNLGFPLFAPISLPLISYGNTAMIINLCQIGFMLSVFRTGDIVMDVKISSISKQNKFFNWDSGKLTINFKS